MSIENAKKLLRKAIELQDEELIEMANQALSSVYKEGSGNIKSPEPKAVDVKHDPLHKHAHQNITDDVFSEGKTGEDGDFIFKMHNKNNESANRGGIPVNEIKDRVNSFVDDGSEAKDVSTPKVDLAQRRPPFKPVTQVCQKCKSKTTVHPAHQRDFFVCDKCIPK